MGIEYSREKFKRFLLSFGGLLLLYFVSKVFIFSDPENEKSDLQYEKLINSHYKIFSLTVPDSLSFSGELVPLNKIDVREKLDRELLVNTYWQSQTLLFHKRTSRWFPIIEPILKTNGIPDDFKYLALIESGLVNSISPAGATGFWQFLKNTGKEYGLEIDDEIDERYHVEKATKAACHYLKDAYAKYENWTLSAAAYNMGMHALDRQIKKQGVKDYYELYLNEETSRYLFRILAAKEILTHSKKYGFHLREKDLYPVYETRSIAVDSSIEDLTAFARSQKVNYKVLKVLNPWIRGNSITNKEEKVYRIALPQPNDSSFGEILLPDSGSIAFE